MHIEERLFTGIKVEYDVVVYGGVGRVVAELSEDVATIDICRLPDELKHQGVVLHEKDL